MAEKERKLWAGDEKTYKERISTLEERLDKLVDELDQREETDKLVQGHVQELILQN